VILILLIGLVLIAVSFGLFARSLLLPRLRAAESLRQIDVYGFSGTAAASPAEATGGRLPRLHLREGMDSLAARLGTFVSGHVKSLSEENLRRLLLGAGVYTVQPRRFVGYQALGTLVLGALSIWFAIAGDGNPLLSLVLVIATFLCAWTLPVMYLKRRARTRGERIDLDMPDLIDMLVATVEAGIAFSSSLQMASKRLRGPLGEELRLTLQEQSMGLGLNDALNNMLTRQSTPSVRAFVRSLIQGEQLGVSIGQTLRSLSREMRTLRRQLAEERAQKAPVKLVFPVVLLSCPALFVVTLGPAFIQIHGIFS
jgi:tight adherence protein C